MSFEHYQSVAEPIRPYTPTDSRPDFHVRPFYTSFQQPAGSQFGMPEHFQSQLIDNKQGHNLSLDESSKGGKSYIRSPPTFEASFSRQPADVGRSQSYNLRQPYAMPKLTVIENDDSRFLGGLSTEKTATAVFDSNCYGDDVAQQDFVSLKKQLLDAQTTLGFMRKEKLRTEHE